MYLHSPQLAFSRDGRTLIALGDGGITLTEVEGGGAEHRAFDHPRAVVSLAEELWIVHGSEPALSRCDRGGHRIEPALPLPAGGTLVAAAVGIPAALWTSSPPKVLLADRGALRATDGPTGVELALPLTGRRWVTCSGGRITAPSGLSCELPAGARIVGGAIILDGDAAAVVVDHATGRELIALRLSNGRPHLRQRMPVARTRVAVRRGVMALLVGPRRLALVDLRSGRALGEIGVDFDIEDFALDPDGARAAVRGASTVELIGLRRAADTTAAITLTPPPEAPEPEPPRPSTSSHAPSEPDATPQVVLPARPLDLRALVPRHGAPAPLSRADALTFLDRELRTVGLLALRAIAEAWNTRRIGYGNEGHHPYEHEVAALLGMNRGFATEHLAAANAHLADHDRALSTIPDRRGAHTPIGELAAELGLGPLAIDILFVVAAPALWSPAARLYGVLANDRERALVDEALVEQIFEARCSRHDIAAELDPRAPLVRFGLISVDDARARPFASLEVDPITLARLRREPPDLGPGLTVRGSDRALEELWLAPSVIPEALDALARVSGPARFVLRGRPGTGRRTLLAALAAEAGRALGILDATLLPRGDRELARALRAGLRRGHLAGLLPCIVGLEHVAYGEREGRDAVVEALRSHPGPLAVVLPPGEAAPLDAGHIAIEVPLLGEGGRLGVWRHALGNAGLPAQSAPRLAARYRIGPGMIQRAVTAARDRGRSLDAIDGFVRQTRDATLGAHARRVERLAAWDDLVLPPDILDSLRELVARVRHRRTVFEAWGMESRLATSRGLTALFSGAPGTGKTLVAGVVARELGLDLYQIDLSKMMSKWLGETERNLAAVFDAAEDGQVVLLFDEADSLFARRTEVRSSNDRYANLEVNFLLQRLDSFEGIAILTTNASGSIDPAFKRRLSFRLSFPFPDEETRTELWRAHLPSTLPTQAPLDLDRLARKYQLSGGYIRNACLRAAFLAAEDATAVTQAHLERAVALEFAELGKLSSSGAIE